MVRYNSSICSVFVIENTSSTYLFHGFMLLLSENTLRCKSCMTASAKKLERGDPMGCRMFVCSTSYGIEIR